MHSRRSSGSLCIYDVREAVWISRYHSNGGKKSSPKTLFLPVPFVSMERQGTEGTYSHELSCRLSSLSVIRVSVTNHVKTTTLLQAAMAMMIS